MKPTLLWMVCLIGFCQSLAWGGLEERLEDWATEKTREMQQGQQEAKETAQDKCSILELLLKNIVSRLEARQKGLEIERTVEDFVMYVHLRAQYHAIYRCSLAIDLIGPEHKSSICNVLTSDFNDNNTDKSEYLKWAVNAFNVMKCDKSPLTKREQGQGLKRYHIAARAAYNPERTKVLPPRAAPPADPAPRSTPAVPMPTATAPPPAHAAPARTLEVASPPPPESHTVVVAPAHSVTEVHPVKAHPAEVPPKDLDSPHASSPTGSDVSPHLDHPVSPTGSTRSTGSLASVPSTVALRGPESPTHSEVSSPLSARSQRSLHDSPSTHSLTPSTTSPPPLVGPDNPTETRLQRYLRQAAEMGKHHREHRAALKGEKEKRLAELAEKYDNEHKKILEKFFSNSKNYTDVEKEGRRLLQKAHILEKTESTPEAMKALDELYGKQKKIEEELETQKKQKEERLAKLDKKYEETFQKEFPHMAMKKKGRRLLQEASRIPLKDKTQSEEKTKKTAEGNRLLKRAHILEEKGSTPEAMKALDELYGEQKKIEEEFEIQEKQKEEQLAKLDKEYEETFQKEFPQFETHMAMKKKGRRLLQEARELKIKNEEGMDALNRLYDEEQETKPKEIEEIEQEFKAREKQARQIRQALRASTDCQTPGTEPSLELVENWIQIFMAYPEQDKEMRHLTTQLQQQAAALRPRE